MLRRVVRAGSLAVLGAAGVYAFAFAWGYSQTRFFSIDEYQFGHATWLVAQGWLPYVDFFEHHFPLSYVLHAPLFVPERDAVTDALLLRKIVFATGLATSLVAGVCCYLVTRSAAAALLSTFLPPSFGFTLMSAIDYRADNFGAFYFVACLALLEWNRRADRPGVAAVCGLLAAVAAGMTQKMTFLAGCTTGAMFLADRVRLARAAAGDEVVPWVARPAWFFGAAAAAGGVFLAVSGALGILGKAFELTIVQAAQHEQYYDRFSIFEKGYVTPFWEATRWSTIPILSFAGIHLATRAGRFWLFPVGVALLAGTLMVAPYPYNFVFLCWVGVLCAARGFVRSGEWLVDRVPALAGAAPLLPLLALPALVDQTRFLDAPITNAHQLRVLQRIDEYADPMDTVIDNAGGAMFQWHASYYFHHGAAHRKMFADYFREQLLRDYRESRARFWIRDLRSKSLPENVQDYLEQHYVHAGGDLWVIGFTTPATTADPATATLEVVREDDYYVHRMTEPPPGRPERPTDLWIDGRPLLRPRIHLRERRYQVRILPNSPEYVIAPFPASFFHSGGSGEEQSRGPDGRRLHFSMLFQHGVGREAADEAAPETRDPPGASPSSPGPSSEGQSR